ncbi:universal stress protein [Pontibacter sp. E15-1]|uniref:universal stress protein n=1 Tax=Pontibacter sp. E15-1 TaxID=2919918 RepID=UPI001F4F6DD5|nr:universal stress protein [Pontibacter sp. E15-1]MCJ8165240.1 universal stress protein [Pontibacter sp. E15-1]
MAIPTGRVWPAKTKRDRTHVYTSTPKPYTPMFKIIVPVDFEDSTYNACHYALRLAAAAPPAEILLLHCFRDYLTDPWELPLGETQAQTTASEKITERVLHRNEDDERAKLDELRQELQESLTDSQQVQLSTAFVNGLPEEVIPVEARRLQTDLIVMGTEGDDSLSRSVFGTITTKMAKEARVPVLSVPAHARERNLTRILYATDFDAADAQAIADLHQFLAPFSPQILCLHITKEQATAQDQQKMADLEAALKRLVPTGNIRYKLLESPDVADALEDFVAKEQVDLLAATNRKRSFLDSLLHPSLTKKLVLESEVPLLIFHGRDA